MLQPTYTVGHYENFPVASIVLPKRYRSAVASLYHFARYADDLADEGDMAAAERIKHLEACAKGLHDIERGILPTHPLLQALRNTYHACTFPMALCLDLISAFKQDVVKPRYQTIEELLDYCRRSANPVGRLFLHIVDQATPDNLLLADNVCTGLQLINFLQDIVIDYQKGRVYLPQDELVHFRVSEADIAQQRFSCAFAALMQHQIDRADHFLQAGALLGQRLSGRIGLEIRMIILGGKAILRKLQARQGDVFKHRPQLSRGDWISILYRAVRKTC